MIYYSPFEENDKKGRRNPKVVKLISIVMLTDRFVFPPTGAVSDWTCDGPP